MLEPPIPSNEAERLELIRQLDILDTSAEEAYDGIVYVASLICGTPLSTITIIDRNRQWFKARIGLKNQESPRLYSFCAHAILGNEILEVPDSQKDERFKDNPVVTGDPHVRFYAGAPLELKDGLRVGTLCVIDHKPKKLNEHQLKALEILGLHVTKLLELRLKIKEVETLRENDANVVNMLTHELRNPLTSIYGFLAMLADEFKDNEIIEKCSINTKRMLSIVNEFLNYSHWKDGFWALDKKKNDINACIRETTVITKGYTDKCKVSLTLVLDEKIPNFDFDYQNISNALENLISNAAKYSPEGGKIILSSELLDNEVLIKVRDFGVGIPVKDQAKVFKPFALYNSVNRTGLKGSGLGLSVTQKIIDKHEGKLGFESIENQGTTFYFTLPLNL